MPKADIAHLAAEYDRLYEAASEVIRRDNPCQIQKGPDGRVTCLRTRSESGYEAKGHEGELCCSGCRHLGPDGCTVKALSCRVWGCSSYQQTALWPQQTRDDLQNIERAARAIGVPLYCRKSKDETFEQMRRVR